MLIVFEPNEENNSERRSSSAKVTKTTIKYDRLWQSDIEFPSISNTHQIDISSSLSTTSSEDEISNSTTYSKPFNLKANNSNNGMSISSNSYEFQQTFNIFLSGKRQSDPQIRYAFYNKGFEVNDTFNRLRKFSLSHYEVQRKPMENINEYGSIENESSVESVETQQCLFSVDDSGIHIDEMGKPYQYNTDNSIDQQLKTNSSQSDPFQSDNNKLKKIKNCEKCGHKPTLQRFFSNAFTWWKPYHVSEYAKFLYYSNSMFCLFLLSLSQQNFQN